MSDDDESTPALTLDHFTESRLRTFAEAADETHIPDQTLRRWAARGRFPVYRIPGERAARIDVAEVWAAVAAMPPRQGGQRPYGANARIVILSETTDQ